MMQSPNLAIRQAYNTLLSAITYNGSPVSVFWQQLPTDVAPGIYIIFGQIRSNDDSDKGSPTTSTSVTVSVYSNDLKYNDGVAVDTVASDIMYVLYRNPQFNIALTGTYFTVIGTTLESDITQDLTQDKQNVYIDRIMVFNHRIFQNMPGWS